jgi:hypothetical protein
MVVLCRTECGFTFWVPLAPVTIYGQALIKKFSQNWVTIVVYQTRFQFQSNAMPVAVNNGN